MIEMINNIHFALVMNIQIIFEAEISQGKRTSVQYTTKSLEIKTIFINLTSNLSVADLLEEINITKKNKMLKIEYVKTLRGTLENISESYITLLIF